MLNNSIHSEKINIKNILNEIADKNIDNVFVLLINYKTDKSNKQNKYQNFKLLLKKDYTFNNIIKVLKNKLSLTEDKTIFLLHNNKILNLNNKVSDIKPDTYNDIKYTVIEYSFRGSFGK